jgi:hypothetical protein
MRRGVEHDCKTPILKSMLNVFALQFSTPAKKAVVKNVLSNPEEFCRQFGQCLQFKPLRPKRDRCSTFLHAKIKRECFAIVHESQQELYSQEVQHQLSFLNKEGNPRKTSCSADFPIETTASVRKKEREKDKGNWWGRGKSEGEERREKRDGKGRVHTPWQIVQVYSTQGGERTRGEMERAAPFYINVSNVTTYNFT